MVSESLAALRAQVDYETRRAARKIHRIATGRFNPLPDDGDPRQNVDISGTKFDPRPSMASGRMTTRQAERALERLREFNNSKSVGYYADSKGNPISRRSLARSRAMVRRGNEQKQRYFEAVKDVPMPWTGDFKAEEYMAAFHPKRTFMRGEAFEVLPEARMPVSYQYTSQEAIDIIIKDREKKLTVSYQRARVQGLRENIHAMLERIGDDGGVRQSVDKLNNDQLWFLAAVDRGFMNSLKDMYIRAQYGASMEEMLEDDTVFATQYESVLETANEASRLSVPSYIGR